MHVPPIAILVSHTVADYDTWKAAFDGHAAARKAAGILGHHINRDGNRVTVYLPATDRARLDAFLASDDLQATMKGAGVTSPPTVEWLEPVEDEHIADRTTAAMIVVHDVSDFAAWKKAYDSVADLRRTGGIIGAAVNRDANRPNRVIVYHQAESADTLQAYAASPGLKAAMQAAGVVGRPDFRFAQAQPGARY